MTNPVIPSYFGSKNVNGLYHAIINLMPEHRYYVEGFLGSGKILLSKKPASGGNYGIDKDAAVIDKFVYHFRSPQSGMTMRPGRIAKNNYAGPKPVKFISSGFIDAFDYECRQIPAMATIDTLIYLDPPYLHNTRTSKHRYNFEMTKMDHIDLLDYVSCLKCRFIISTYDNKLYSSKLKAWNKINVKAMSHGGVRTETIYFNYDAATCKLHDTQYVGKDFTDRQRIQRKIKRNIKKIDAMPPAEKQAFLEAINRKYFLPS